MTPPVIAFRRIHLARRAGLRAFLAFAANGRTERRAVRRGMRLCRAGGLPIRRGGWLCPGQLTRAVIALATERGLQNALSPALTSLVAQEVALATALYVR